MRYRPLGRTNLQVSEVSLGTVELGLDYGIPVAGEVLRPSEAEAVRLLNQALDWGINFIDTARVYGESEAIIGRALKGRRSEYILASKVTHWADEELRGRRLRKWVRASVEESLRALQTDVIDLMQVHSATVEVIRRGEMLGILQDLREAGYIRFIGATTYGEEAALAALEDGGYDCIQIAFNVLDRHAEARVLPLAQERGVGVIVRSVLLKGALTYRYRHLPDDLGELKAAVEQLNALLAREKDPGAPQSLPELAYRYVLAHPGVSTALVGTGRLHELQAAVGYAARGALPQALMEHIRNAVVRDRRQLDPSQWPIQEDAW